MQTSDKEHTPLFGGFLGEEFKSRVALNSKYSLRSFAKFLEISPSYLSMLMKGQRQATADSMLDIGKKLEAPPELVHHWLHLHKETSSQFFYGGRLRHFNFLEAPRYRFIKHWYHYAILELTHTKGFRSSFQWIAQRLGLSLADTQNAIQNLSETGFLDIQIDPWQNISGTNTNIVDTSTSEDRKNLQKEILRQSLNAIDKVDISLRDHTSMTVAIHTSRLPEAKEKIKQFRRELSAFLSEGENPDEVYQLHIGLFPVSKNEECHDS